MEVKSLKIHCAHDAVLPIDELKPNPKNPNTHPDDQLELLAMIMEEQGWRMPIKVSNRSGFIVSGHGRYEAAKLIGVKVAPVDYQDYESDELEYADMIADNRIAELAEIENEKLAELFTEINESDIDNALTGYNYDELDSILNSEPLEFESFDGEGDGGGSYISNGDKVRVVLGALMFDIPDYDHTLYKATKTADKDEMEATIIEILEGLRL